MAIIDDKVVAMSFESSKFESGVSKAIAALEALQKALKFPDAGKGFHELGIASKQVDLGHISKGVDAVAGKLGALRLSAIAIFSQVAGAAINAGVQIAKSLTIAPIGQGYNEYVTKLNSIQTILSNTQAAGTTLKDVSAALKELNDYSDKTIYNFGQMAKNIGTFTAAGVDLDTSVASIKGIANLAALSGANAEKASMAMYQLSQAIASGTVRLQDWISVEHADIGGAVFQRSLAETAVAMGTLKDNMVKLKGPMKTVTIDGMSFRNSLTRPGKDNWLTTDVLTTTLKQFTGDLKDAELAALGFNDAQIDAIQKTAKAATLAATQVKDIGTALKVAAETAGSGFAESAELIFGDYNEAKKTFTALSEGINSVINASADARNKVLGDWKALGGRMVLINAIKTAFHNLGMVLKPIGKAFHDIFPPATGKSLLDLTLKFRDFVALLRPGPQTIDNLRHTFRGLFAVLDIGKQLFLGLFTAVRRIFQVFRGEGNGGILSFTASVGDMLVALDEAMKKGNRITRIFEGLGNVTAGLMKIIAALVNSFKKLFSGFSSGGMTSDMTDMSGAADSLGNAFDKLLGIFEKIVSAFSGGPDIDFQPIADSIAEAVAGIGPAIGKAASQLSFDPILQVIKTGLFAALVVMLKGFLGKGAFADQLGRALGQNINSIGGGILKNISGSFKALEGSLVSMQTNIKAKTLKEIAIAVGILAAAVIALSFVDPKKLGSSLTAMSVAFGQLIGAMALLTVATKSAGFIKLPLITASLILLAGAIDLLTLSVIALSFLSWEQLAKGLAGVGAMLAIIAAASIPLSASSSGLMRTGLALIPLAIGLRILASAVGAFADMNWSEIGRGLVAVAAALGVMAAAGFAMPKNMILIGAGLIAVSFGLKMLAGVVLQFADMDWRTTGKGLAGIAAALGVLAVAMHLMPKSTIIIAAGLIGLVAALRGIQKLVASFAGMSVKELARGLGGLGGALAILAAALYAMSGTLAGATALGIAATSLALLVPSILMLGRASWSKIIKGLVVLAATLTILGVAGMLITPALPGLLGLGVALVLIGAGMAALGAGLWLISSAFSLLVVALPTGIGILIAALNELIMALPELAKNFALALLEIVGMIAIVAPEFVDGILKIIEDIVGLFVKAGPTIALAFGALLTIAVKVITDYAPRLIQAGFALLMALLEGIKNNISHIGQVVAEIIAKLVSAIASKISLIVAAGSKLFLAFLKGIGDHISNVVTTVGLIIAKILSTIANALPRIATAGISIITKLLAAIAQRLPEVIRAGTNVIVQFVAGIGEAGERIVRAARQAAGKFIHTLANEIVKLADDVFDALIDLIQGMADTINKRAPELRTAGKNLGIAIIDGMTFGLASKAQGLYNKVSGIMDHAMSLMHKIPGVNSPSTVTHSIGENIILGLVNGLDANAKDAYNSATAVSHGVIRSFNDTFQIRSPSKVMIEIGKAVGQGFAVGLKGSGEDIKKAFADMNEKLVDQMADSREIIAKEQAKLDELRKSKKPDAKAIKETQDTIKQNEDLLARSTAGHIQLTKALKDEKVELIGLANDYDKITTRLKDAETVLAGVIKERKDFREALTAQYSEGPQLSDLMTQEISDARGQIAQEQAKLNQELAKSKQDPEAIASAQAAIIAAQLAFDKLIEGKVLNAQGTAVDQLATYTQALTNQTSAVGAYQATLEQLRKLGLDDVTYQKLLKEGPADQAFANQLLAGGKTAVKSLNTLDASLMKVSKSLAKNAAANLFDAGVKSKQGLVNGLKKDKNALRIEMENIAEEMVSALKKALKIKSPSQVFAEIGKWSMEGMAKGFQDSKAIVTDAVDQAAKDALLAMKNTMRGISDAVTDELNPNPVITPILDLTLVRTQAEELAAMTKVVPITAAASYGQASMISTTQTAAQSETPDVALAGTNVKFEQNNYSPDSLSEIEIYRQTRNQLSQLKSVLAIT